MAKRPKPATKAPAKAAQSGLPAVIDDGALQFTISSGGQTRECSVDVFEVKLLCERVESQHNLEVKDGSMMATPEFLRDLAGALQTIGVEGATPSIAFQLWVRVGDAFVALQKKMLGTQR